MSARLLLDAISGGSKLMVRAMLAIREGKRQVKRAERLLNHSLIESGVPKDVAKEIAEVYASAGLNMLSIRKMLSLARHADRLESESLILPIR